MGKEEEDSSSKADEQGEKHNDGEPSNNKEEGSDDDSNGPQTAASTTDTTPASSTGTCALSSPKSEGAPTPADETTATERQQAEETLAGGESARGPVEANVKTSTHATTSSTTSTVMSMVPGAVAVPGTQQSPITSNINNNSTSRPARSPLHQEDEEEEPSTTMMVEATAVEEIIATQVVVETSNTVSDLAIQQHQSPRQSGEEIPSSITNPAAAAHLADTVTIQHVDIDNFDEISLENHHHAPGTAGGTTATTSETTTQEKRRVPSYQMIVLAISVVVVGFILISLITTELLFPSFPDDEDYDDDDNATMECRHAYQSTKADLEQLGGIAWIECTLACAVMATIVYEVLNTCQERYCDARPKPNTPAPGIPSYFSNLILVTFEALWFLVAIGILLWIEIKNLREPLDRIEDDCQDLIIDWDTAVVGDLNAYYFAALARVPQFLFLLIARGRLLVNDGACEHIAIFWRRFWYWLKIAMEFEISLLAILSVFEWLRPVVEQMIDLEPLIV
jgi:hypothetical protein